MKSPALGDERSEEYLGMQLVTWLSERVSASITRHSGLLIDNTSYTCMCLPEPLAVSSIINGEGLHTDPKRLLHRINSMKGVKP